MKRDIFFGILLIGIITIGVYTRLVDRVPPIINVVENIEVEYQVGTLLPDFLETITVDDNKSDIVSVFISYEDVDMNTVGEYYINITATDDAGNMANSVIKIYVKDLVSPQVSGYEDIYYVLGSTLPDYVSNLSIYDYNSQVSINDINIDDSQVDYNTPGTYSVEYTISDNDNISKLYINVHVVSVESSAAEVSIGDTINLKTTQLHEGLVFNENWLEDVSLIMTFASSGEASISTHSFTGNIEEDLEGYSFSNEVLEVHYNKILRYVEDNYDLSLMNSVTLKFADVSYRRHMLTLPNSYDLRNYRDDVSTEFQTALEKIDNDELTYEEFFEQFGTHVITELSMGRKYSYVCMDLNDNIQLLINENPCDDNPLSLVNTDSTSFTVSETNSTTILSITKTGLLPIDKTDQKNTELISDWYMTNDYDAPIEYGPDDRGLKPIYLAIPEAYVHLREEMQTALEEYLGMDTGEWY